MASFVHYASPFAETEKPPPPVVLLLLQTDLNVHTSTGLLIHEDLEHLVPSAKKTVVPAMLTRKILEHHDAWEGGERETIIIKTTVHALVDKLLDTTKSLSDQDRELVQEVYRQAAQMHPDLRNLDNARAAGFGKNVVHESQEASGDGSELADVAVQQPTSTPSCIWSDEILSRVTINRSSHHRDHRHIATAKRQVAIASHCLTLPRARPMLQLSLNHGPPSSPSAPATHLLFMFLQDELALLPLRVARLAHFLAPPSDLLPLPQLLSPMRLMPYLWLISVDARTATSAAVPPAPVPVPAPTPPPPMLLPAIKL
ncbi:hypothetical protein B0H13DRAFT_2301058 [Mycena leptocephala]|nr:hypothetical protein B0H13DRAFT_2301058 [Mycena leptocephala]